MPKRSFAPETEKMLRDLGFAVAEYARKKAKVTGSKGKKGARPGKAPEDIVVPICLLLADGDYCKDPLPWPPPGPRRFTVRFEADDLPKPDLSPVKRPRK